MIPYFELREIPLFGDVSLSAFGVLVVSGVLVGVWYAHHRARVLGVPSEDISNAILWALIVGFLGSHIVEVVLYRPQQLRESGPGALLEFWKGMSSFGGFFGALLGLGIHFVRSRHHRLVTAEILLQSLVLGWAFGRLGCTLVHDHIGRRSDFVLAIHFPDAPRHDLGLYELLYTLLVLVPAVFVINRREPPPGTTIAVIGLLYAPARFLADFLRHTDLAGADARYLDLTPAQYGCLLLVPIALYFWPRRQIS